MCSNPVTNKKHSRLKEKEKGKEGRTGKCQQNKPQNGIIISIVLQTALSAFSFVKFVFC